MKKFIKVIVCFFCAVLIFQGNAASAGQYDEMSIEELSKKISALNIGLGEYMIGTVLAEDKLAFAIEHREKKAHKGTIKFKDQGVFVIINEKSHLIIAVFKQNKNADKNAVRTLVGELMLQYGEPTAMAHETSMYWTYNEDGLISEELYRTVKNEDKLHTLDVLATIKFNSSFSILSAKPKDKQNKDNKEQNDKKDELINDIYVMIQSDALSKKFM